jgi:hypothetical protein
MKKTVLLCTVLLTFLVACQGQQVELPAPGEETTSEKPLFGLLVGPSEKDVTDNEVTFTIPWTAINANQNANTEDKPLVYFSILNGSDVVQGRAVTSPELNDETSIELSITPEEYEQFCGKSVTLHAAVNPERGELPSTNVLGEDYSAIPEADPGLADIGLPSDYAQEHRDSVFIICQGSNKGTLEPVNSLDISDLRVNRETLRQRSPHRYVDPDDVNIADVEKTGSHWHVLFRGKAYAPDYANYDAVWKGKVSSFPSGDLAQTAEAELLRYLPESMGPKGVLQGITSVPGISGAQPAVLGVRDNNLYRLGGFDSPEGDISIRGEKDFAEAGKLYDVAKAPLAGRLSGGEGAEKTVLADRGANRESAFLLETLDDSSAIDNVNQLSQESLQGSIINMESFIWNGRTMYLVGSWTEPTVYVYDSSFDFVGKTSLNGRTDDTGTMDIDDESLLVIDYDGWHDTPMEEYRLSDIVNASMT